MNPPRYQPWLFHYAVLTVIVALLAVVAGALVTTKNAGMAFRDWPTSDGHNMFLYPWLESAGNEFLEHGHRLAGSLIGMVSIGLAGLLWWKETRMPVRLLGAGVLACVIFQGILGGTRVLWDQKTLAMLHGSFGALVLSLMALTAQMTSRRWFEIEKQPLPEYSPQWSVIKFFSVALPAVIMVQYFMGGLLRHLGTALFEHMGGAVAVLIVAISGIVLAHRSQVGWIKRSAWLLLLIVLVQISLGAGTFVTKFGFKSTGYVAVQYSIEQVTFRTVHTVVGILLLMTSVIHAARVSRVTSLVRRQYIAAPVTLSLLPVSLKGGVG